MCGIFGYAGEQDSQGIIIEGLKSLSYRGYDSAGISVYSSGIHTRKRAGKIEVLCEELKLNPLPRSSVGIGHTRWATHGSVTDENSHPHGNKEVSIVHNGIIENYLLLKQKLVSFGYSFTSQTDTEVAVLLIDYFYKKLGDPCCAIREATDKMRGSYAIAAIFKDRPDTVFAIRHESPLIIGVGNGETFIASDMPAFLKYTDKYFRLADNEIAIVTKEGHKIIGKNGILVKKNLQKAPYDTQSAEKNGYAHFMRKEISEEKAIISRLGCIYSDCHGTPKFDLDEDMLRAVTHVTVVGCGTAYHAGLYLKMMSEKYLKLRCEAFIASEFRYSTPIFDKGELVIFISQSGETADTLTALRAVKKNGVKTLGIVNVVDSSIATEADAVIYTHAGAEIAVASTKAYSAQCTVAALLTAYLAKVRDSLSKNELLALTKEIKELPSYIQRVYKEEEAIEEAAELIKDSEHLFFIGRRGEYLAAIEGSLKLKEITYIHSESYPAGELKHGTISLITENTPVIALFGSNELRDKTLSSLKEVAARGARTIAISPADKEVAEVSDFMLNIPTLTESLFPIVAATALQLLAYHTAVKRGCDVDQPRNLAKSVTVE